MKGKEDKGVENGTYNRRHAGCVCMYVCMYVGMSYVLAGQKRFSYECCRKIMKTLVKGISVTLFIELDVIRRQHHQDLSLRKL